MSHGTANINSEETNIHLWDEQQKFGFITGRQLNLSVVRLFLALTRNNRNVVVLEIRYFVVKKTVHTYTPGSIIRGCLNEEKYRKLCVERNARQNIETANDELAEWNIAVSIRSIILLSILKEKNRCVFKCDLWHIHCVACVNSLFSATMVIIEMAAFNFSRLLFILSNWIRYSSLTSFLHSMAFRSSSDTSVSMANTFTSI